MATVPSATRRAAPRRGPPSRLVATPDLLVPRPPRPAMRRVRLFDALDAGSEGRLVLISAPAGAGKTALLSTWLAERRRKRVGVDVAAAAPWGKCILGAVPRRPPARRSGEHRPGSPGRTARGYSGRIRRPAPERRRGAAVSGDARHRRLPQPSSHRSRQWDRAAPTSRDPEAPADHLHAPRSRPARPRLPGERRAGRASCRRSRLHR